MPVLPAIFNFFWHSGTLALSGARVPECQKKLKMGGKTGMAPNALKCNHLASLGLKGLWQKSTVVVSVGSEKEKIQKYKKEKKERKYQQYCSQLMQSSDYLNVTKSFFDTIHKCRFLGGVDSWRLEDVDGGNNSVASDSGTDIMTTERQTTSNHKCHVLIKPTIQNSLWFTTNVEYTAVCTNVNGDM